MNILFWVYFFAGHPAVNHAQNLIKFWQHNFLVVVVGGFFFFFFFAILSERKVILVDYCKI